MSELLRCDNLCKRFGRRDALNGLTFTVESGRIVGLLGPNGAGKTTLIKIINGLLTPTSGTITIDGDPPGVITKPKVSYLPDVNYLNNWMTVEQIVKMFTDFYEDFRPELAYEMIEKLRIDRKSNLKSLSKGNKEKVCLILVMSRSAKLYVLDEPIAGVDPATRDYIVSTIIGNYNPDASVLISTHLIADIETALDEVVYINNGKVVMQSSVEEIREKYGMSIDEHFREVFRWSRS